MDAIRAVVLFLALIVSLFTTSESFDEPMGE